MTLLAFISALLALDRINQDAALIGAIPLAAVFVLIDLATSPMVMP